MSLVKRDYVDQVTVITAENLNAIQDAIIENEEAIEEQEEAISGLDTSKADKTALSALGLSVVNGMLCATYNT